MPRSTLLLVLAVLALASACVTSAKGAPSAPLELVVLGSGIMILGALAISTAVAEEEEAENTRLALCRECERYNQGC